MHTLTNPVLERVLFGPVLSAWCYLVHGVCAGWHADRIPSFLRVIAELTAGVLGIRIFTAASPSLAGEVGPRPTALPGELGH